MSTSDGRSVPCETETGGRRVLLKPARSTLWPISSELTLVIRKGLAVPFRANDGRTLDRDTIVTLQTGAHVLDYGRPLTFSLPDAGETVSLQVGDSLKVLSSLILSPDSVEELRAGTIMRQITPEGTLGPILSPELVIEADGLSIRINPWPEGRGFEPSARYKLMIPRTVLRARNGREAERDLVLTLSAAREAGFEGHLDISFAKEDLPDAENQDGTDSSQYAEPRLSRITSRLAGTGGERIMDEAPRVWDREGSHFQMRIPGIMLGSDPGLITGLSWFCALPLERSHRYDRGSTPPDLLSSDLVFPRLLLRIGAASTAAQANGLSPDFEANFSSWSTTPPLRTVAQGSRRGEYVVRNRKVSWQERADDELYPANGAWIDLMFEHPYPYAGGRRDLVVEIENAQGFSTLSGNATPSTCREPLWSVIPAQGGGPNFLLAARDGISEKRVLSLEFATKIHIQTYEDVVSAWHEATLDDPEFFIIPAGDYLDARGTENQDFQFSFQGMRPDGTVTPWTRLEAINNCRKIRVRLRFLPQTGAGFGLEVQVRRLRIRYRRK